MAKVNVGIETSSWVNIAVGLLVAGAAYYYTTTYNSAFYSGLVSGIILVAIGVFTAWAAASGRSRSALWPSVATLVVGAWLVGFPWFTSESSTYQYSEAILGFIAGAISIYEIVKANREEPMRGKPAM